MRIRIILILLQVKTVSVERGRGRRSSWPVLLLLCWPRSLELSPKASFLHVGFVELSPLESTMELLYVRAARLVYDYFQKYFIKDIFRVSFGDELFTVTWQLWFVEPEDNAMSLARVGFTANCADTTGVSRLG